MRAFLSLYLALVITDQTLAADRFELDPAISVVSFATIKKQYVVEPATMTSLSGQVKANGLTHLYLPINQLDTGVALRNQRLRTIIFDSGQYPNIILTAQVPPELLTTESVISQISLPISVTLRDQTTTFDVPLNIINTGDLIVIASVEPFIVDVHKLNVTKTQMIRLADTVGAIAIASQIPVSFSLLFRRKASIIHTDPDSRLAIDEHKATQ